MDYEKKYKEALSRAKDCHVNKKFSELDNNAQELCEYIFPELYESEDEKIRKAMYNCVKWFGFDSHYFKNVSQEECLAWLEKQGKEETDGWKEGNIIRHGGILALVIKGRRAMKSKGELFTVQYPGEWVKAAPNEIESFLNELEKQGEPQPYRGNADTMRKNLIKAFKSVGNKHWGGFDVRDIIHFLESKDAIELEKQGETNETINRDKFAQGVLRGVAINLITWIDYNAAEGNMCLSNMECEDIENALVSGNWDKIYDYIKKKLEKQGEQFAKEKQQWIEKAVIFLNERVCTEMSIPEIHNMIVDFRKSMEE